MKKTLFLKIYIGLSLIYLIILFFGYEYLNFYLKPLLIPLLAIGVYFSNKFPSKKIILTALLFSWIGDVILLFSEIAELYFILGLVAFLISHVFYCILFNKQKNIATKLNTVYFLLGFIVIAFYLGGMLVVLLPSLGELKIPVIVYASVISLMLLFAFRGFLTWKRDANSYILTGAIIFVLSDSILAVNKFYTPIEKSSFFIMLTYLMAQYLIVFGILKLNSNSKIAA